MHERSIAMVDDTAHLHNANLEYEVKSFSTCGVILAGGRSSRMNGEMKSLLPVAGLPMIEIIAMQMRTLCQRVAAVAAYEFQAEKLQEQGLTVIMDEAPDNGPLAAFHTALQHVEEELIWLSACDMPLVDAHVAKWMIGRLMASGASAVIPQIGGKLHPLQAMYRKQRCLAVTSSLIAAGQRSMMGMLQQLELLIIDEEEFIEAGFNPQFVCNINTVDEYNRLLHDNYEAASAIPIMREVH